MQRASPSESSGASRSGFRPSPYTRSARAAARWLAATREARCASGRSRPARTPARPVTAGPAGRLSPTRTCSSAGYRALPGGLELDRAAAAAALGDLDPAAVIDVVNAEMLRALRVVSVEQGHDPRGFALVAYGGSGPLHACALAEELGIETVLVPEAAGVLSALGLVASEERRDHVVSYLCPLVEAGELPAQGEADLRYRGQSFELTVPLQPNLGNAFHRAHEERYGYADQAREVELVAVRTAEVVPAPELALQASARRTVAGPALVELPGSTCWVPDGWSGETNADGTLVLGR